jgi:hypothetical protein
MKKLCSLERCPTWEQCEKGKRCLLNAVTDKVLSHRAAARTKKAKKRQRARRKVQRESSI